MLSSLRDATKRYGANIDRFPEGTKKMLFKFAAMTQIPAFRSDKGELPKERIFTRPEQWKVEIGDRVLITKGRFKGHVTKVLAFHRSTNELFVEQSETKKMVIPKQYWQAGQQSHVINYPKPISPRDVKVVSTMVEIGKDGVEKRTEIAADDVVFKGMYWDADYGKMMPYRRVKYHENIIIPWPRPEPVEDDAFATSKEDSEERTYIPNSIVRTDSPPGIVESMRSPIMRRKYKWDKQVISRSDEKRLTPSEMPISAAKKAGMEERQKINESIPKKPTEETVNLVGSRVATLLNGVTDANFAAWVNSVAPDSKLKNLEKKEKEKKILAEKTREAHQRNIIRHRIITKYKNQGRRWRSSTIL